MFFHQGALLSGLLLIVIINGDMQAQNSSSAGDYVAQGDKSAKASDYQSALGAYQKALEIDPNHFEAAYKVAQMYVRIGETSTDNKQKLDSFRRAVEFAQRAKEINPRSSKGYVFKCIALGRLAQHSDPKEGLRISKEMKKEIDRALELDPASDAAWEVLGQWHRRFATMSAVEKSFANWFLGGVPEGASAEKAIECFKKAIEIDPSFGGHYIELGITYEKLDRKEDAVRTYQKVLTLPAAGQAGVRYKDLARSHLEKLGAQ